MMKTFLGKWRHADGSYVGDGVLRWSGVFIFGLLLWQALGETYGDYTPPFMIGLATLIMVAIGGLAMLAQRQTVERRFLMVAIVVSLALIIRVAWALNVPTKPVSDFDWYNSLAMSLAQGEEPDQPVQNQGYIFLLSMAYRCFPDPVAGRLLNVLGSTAVILVLYGLGVRLANPFVGVAACLPAVIFPSEVCLTSVLCTDILATLGLLCAWLAGLSSGPDSIGRRAALLSGLSFAVGFSVRFQVFFFLPIVLISIVIRSRSAHATVRALSYFVGGIALWITVLNSGYMLSLGRPHLVHFRQMATPWLTGNNISAHGVWNPADDALYHSYPKEQRNSEARRIACKRILENPMRFLAFVPEKWCRLLAEDRYGAGFSVPDAHSPWWDASEAKRLRVSDRIDDFSQAMYIVILALVVISFLIPPINPTERYLAIAMVIMTIPFIILEVQARYHHLLMPFLLLSAASAFFKVANKVNAYLSGREIKSVCG